MRRRPSALALALLAAALPAQGKSHGAKPAGLDQLTSEWDTANKAYRAAMTKVEASDAYQKAREAKDSATMRKLLDAVARPDAKAFGQRALALAERCQGDDQATVLTYAALHFRDPDTIKTAVARLQKDHIESPAMAELMESAVSLVRYVGMEDSEALLDGVIADNPNALPRAWAMYWKAYLIRRNRKASDEDKARAAGLMAQAAKLAEGTDLALRIAAPRFEKEHLQIGMQAPEIVGQDIDGVPMKLSDYRGKVVVLDFWGFW